MDLNEINKAHIELALKLKLDSKDTLESMAIQAMVTSLPLLRRGKKTVVKEKIKELSLIESKAEELAALIGALPLSLKNDFSTILVSIKGMSIEGSNGVVISCCEAIADAARTISKVKLQPIPDGFYNAFLFSYISSYIDRMSFFDFDYETKIEFEKYLNMRWLQDRIKISKISTQIICLRLKSDDFKVDANSNELDLARETVDNNIGKIFKIVKQRALKRWERNNSDNLV